MAACSVVRRITVPLMLPVFFLVSILTILGPMQIYDIIVATTNGGPAGHTEVPITQILLAMESITGGVHTINDQSAKAASA